MIIRNNNPRPNKSIPHFLYTFLLWVFFFLPNTCISQKTTEEAIQLQHRADAFLDSAQWDSSLKYYRIAGEFYRKTAQWESYRRCLRGISKVAIGEKKYDDAIVSLREGIQVLKLAPGNHGDQTDLALHSLATMLQAAGKYNQAKSVFLEELSVATKVYGAESDDVAGILMDIGGIDYLNKSYKSAISYYLRSLEMMEKINRPVDEVMAGLLSNIAISYQQISNNESAFFFQRKAIKARIDLLGADDPYVGDSYQALSNIFRNTGQGDSMMYYLNKAKVIYEKSSESQDYRLMVLASNTADYYFTRENYETALSFYLQEQAHALAAFGENHPLIINSKVKIGKAYAGLGNVRESIFYFQEALDFVALSTEVSESFVATIYTNIQQLYFNTHDYRNSLDFAFKALTIQLGASDEDPEALAELYGKIGTLYERMGNLPLAVRYLEKSLELYRILSGENHPAFANVLIELAVSCAATGDYPRAFLLINQALEIQSRQYPPTHINIGLGFINRAKILRDWGKTEDALTDYNRALRVFEHNQQAGKSDIYLTYNSIAKILHKKNLLWEALDQNQKAFTIAYPNFHPKSIHDLPSENKAYNHAVGEFLLFQEKGEILLDISKQKNNDIQYATSAFESLKMAMKMAEAIRNNYQKEDSRLVFQTQTHALYETAIEAAWVLYEADSTDQLAEEIFAITERSKSAALNDVFRQNQAKHFAGIPDSLVALEKHYLQLMLSYENLLAKETNKGPAMNRELFEIRENAYSALSEKYKTLQNYLQKNYPAYEALVMKQEIVLLNSIQQTAVEKNKTLVNYFLGNKSLFITVAGKTRFIRRVPLPENFEDQVVTFLNLVKNPHAELKAFSNVAVDLYNLLIKPIGEEIQTPALVIVPDGLLTYLPFEVLISAKNEDTNWRTLPYLFQKYAISYAFSASLFAHLSDQPYSRKLRNRYLAFAPSFQNQHYSGDSLYASAIRGSDLAELPGTTREIQLLNKYFQGTQYTGDAANEAAFKSLSRGYSIIHLATHAIVDDNYPENSRLLFSPTPDSALLAEGNEGDLYPWEIFPLQLNARMVVLSACNTGFGKLQRGEGVMSLGRAFAYAGVPGIVMSLWPAEDAVTAELMGYFYEYLAEGDARDEALKKARSRYLETAEPDALRPFYWAGFICQGDTTPLVSVPYWGYLIGITALLLCAFSLLVYFLRNKKLTNSFPRHTQV
ncbi:MAG: CHAT domain-containing tetratricopeptide repeat protein [Bacteroidia bacterium]